MNKIKYFLVILLFGAPLMGCQTTGPSALATGTIELAGTAPVYLSKATALAFQRYKSRPGSNEGAFAIQPSGRSFYFTNCTRLCNYKEGSAAKAAVSRCESRINKPCKLFAAGRNVVWKGAVTYPTWPKDEYPLTLSYTANIAKRSTSYSSGKAMFNDNGTSAKLSITLKKRYCEGTADISKGTWALDCGSDRHYSGKISASSISKYWGKSADGFWTISIEEHPGA